MAAVDMPKTPENDDYAQTLAAKGLDPAQASAIAKRSRRPRQQEERTPDLFAPPLAASSAPAHQTRAVSSLIESSATILTEAPCGSEIAYLHAILCQVGLPRGPKAVDGMTVFERICGGAALRITAGALWDGKRLVQQPIPYRVQPTYV